MSKLFSPITIRGETIPNRVFVSPMCQYSSETEDGQPGIWHNIHYGTRAVGGAGLVMIEATSVQAEGRITPWDLGIWSDDHTDTYRPIVDAINSRGATPAIQLAHAGRKASHDKPWAGGATLDLAHGGWQVVAPSPLSFDDSYADPRELSIEDIDGVVADFANSTKRSIDAGIRVIELHMAHGYLGCEFLSPLSNHRSDNYGGSLENRARFPLEVVRAVRKEMPDSMPLFVRVSATEYMDDGWDIDECVELARWFKEEGVDMIDCSSGGNSPAQTLKPFPGYQVQFATRIRNEADIPTAAVGLSTEPKQAEEVLTNGEADAILLGRVLLRSPYWPIEAQAELDEEIGWPSQYLRGRELAQFTQPSR